MKLTLVPFSPTQKYLLIILANFIYSNPWSQQRNKTMPEHCVKFRINTTLNNQKYQDQEKVKIYDTRNLKKKLLEKSSEYIIMWFMYLL